MQPRGGQVAEPNPSPTTPPKRCKEEEKEGRESGTEKERKKKITDHSMERKEAIPAENPKERKKETHLK